MGTVPAEKGEGSREARHYCLVREDLAPEMKMVMIGHAAGESGVLGLAPDSRTAFIALQAEAGPMELLATALDRRGIKYVRITGVYEPEVGALLALGIEPSTEARLRKLVWHFRKASASGGSG